MNLNTIKEVNSANYSMTNNWVDIRNIEKDALLSNQYKNICEEHVLNNKWILMINPEDNSLASLSNSKDLDTSKILKVNTNKTKINLENIETALCHGNCSAVILCNPSLRKSELAKLNQFAEKGQTACIVLNNSTTLH